ATGSGGTLLSTSCGEYTNSVLPAAMNALKLSGEKSAEIALPMMNVSTRFEPVSNTRTRPPATSETITFTPSGEIARTLPGTCGTCDTPLVVRSTVINPAALPRKARLPAGLISSELGAEGRVIAVPAVFVLVSIGTIDVPALLAASTVVEFAVPVTVIVIGLPYTARPRFELQLGGVHDAITVAVPGAIPLINPPATTVATAGAEEL